MNALRDFMFAHVYLGPSVRAEHVRIANVLCTLFEHYVEHPHSLPDGGGASGADLAQRVTDYLAGMTDRYAIRAFTELSVPREFAR